MFLIIFFKFFFDIATQPSVLVYFFFAIWTKIALPLFFLTGFKLKSKTKIIS